MQAHETVLVTGAAGFLGSALVRELLGRGRAVCGVDDLSSRAGLPPARLPAEVELVRGDVTQPGVLEEALARSGECAAFVHLAARVGVRAVLADSEGCAVSNRAGVERLLEAVAELPAARRPRVFFASSSEVYAARSGLLTETGALREERQGRWAYAASKIAGEHLLAQAASLWPAERAPVCWRFFNVVGPGQSARSGMVLPNFLECARRGEPLPVHGDGRQTRTYARVDEVARTLADLVLHGELPGGSLNVGGRARASVRELAECVLRHSGSRAGIAAVDPRAHQGASFEEVAERAPDLARLESLGVFLPRASLDEIVEDAWARHFDGEERRCASLAS
ncbi:MAG: NAD-dependent epimerase/dehydratase family protein [Planctomycetes bacterium]|nr:NAD-dependent epimerase/dehydratase family protein [Planctomycetota bacterium]